MVSNEYPTPDEEQMQKEMVQELVESRENAHDNVVEQPERAESEEYSNDIGRCLEDDAYTADIGIKALEDELDHLQTALDHLEKKNDDIHAELIDLLQSNREARKQFRESLQDCKFQQ